MLLYAITSTFLTVVAREDKYKTKSFIDTVVYRLGDQAGAWSWVLLGVVGLGAGATAWVAVPLSVVWLANAWWLGRRQERLASAEPAARPRTEPAGHTVPGPSGGNGA
jgi:AAA family ATP:ADP antiporter